MGEGANLLAGWERSAGLRAPPAPAHGVLAPNGTGYLLAVGPAAQRLYPRAASAARWISALAVPVVAAMPFLLVPAPYGPVGVVALGALGCWLPGALLSVVARARLARRLEAAASPGVGVAASGDSPSAPAPSPTFSPTLLPGLVEPARARRGSLVRLDGTVAEQATVSSLFTGRAVVLAVSDCAGVVETRGIDFDVRLAGGERVRVPARDALLLGRGRRLRGAPQCGPLTLTMSGGAARLRSALLSTDGWIGRLLGLAARELTLGPGDAVEICGALDFEPDESSQRGFARGPALRAVLRPVGGVPVIVRKRAAAQDPPDNGAGAGTGAGTSPARPGTVTSAPG